MNTPIVNLGQSEFQDTFMVVNEELTAYRKLRKLELHIRELIDVLKKHDFGERKTVIKLKRLNLEDELDAIEAEELEWDIKNIQTLKQDAEKRLANFEEMKRQLLEATPQEYWDQGFEQSEAEYWINFYIRRASLDILANGHIQRGTLDQITTLPEELAKAIMSNVPLEVNRISQITIEADKTQARLLEEQKKLEEAEQG